MSGVAELGAAGAAPEAGVELAAAAGAAVELAAGAGFTTGAALDGVLVVAAADAEAAAEDVEPAEAAAADAAGIKAAEDAELATACVVTAAGADAAEVAPGAVAESDELSMLAVEAVTKTPSREAESLMSSSPEVIRPLFKGPRTGVAVGVAAAAGKALPGVVATGPGALEVATVAAAAAA